MKKIILLILCVTLVTSPLTGNFTTFANGSYDASTWSGYSTNSITPKITATDEDNGTKISFFRGKNNGGFCSTPIDPNNFKFTINLMALSFIIGSNVEYKFLDTPNETVDNAKGFGIRLTWVDESLFRADLVVYNGNDSPEIVIIGTEQSGSLNDDMTGIVSFDISSGILKFGQADLTEQATNSSFINLTNSLGNAYLHVKYTNGGANCSTIFSNFGYAKIPSMNTYKMDLANGIITGIIEKTNITKLNLENINTTIPLKAFYNNGIENTNDYIGTGMTVELYDENACLHTLTVVIKGDIDGNGLINLNDLVLVRNDLLDISKLTGVSKTAGDIYNEESISLNDLIGIMGAVSENGTINQY